jgi:hypothetical protein
MITYDNVHENKIWRGPRGDTAEPYDAHQVPRETYHAILCPLNFMFLDIPSNSTA